MTALTKQERDWLAARVTYIGIAGAKRAGKDTLARGLAEALAPIPVDSFAAPIRRFMADLLGWSLEELEARKEDRVSWLGTTPRRMMQTLGTEWGRNLVDPELWVASAFARNPTGAILSDVRFRDEARAIRDDYGVVIRVSRPGFEPGRDTHASERPLPANLVDIELVNDGTPEQLIQRALRALYDWHREAGRQP